LKVDFQGSRVTSDGGLILVRELDERLGLEKLIEEHLRDSRQAVPVTIEQKQRVVADRFEVPVVGAALLLTVNRTLAGIHVEHDAAGAVERLSLPQFTLADLLRQSVYSRLAGYEDVNDAERPAYFTPSSSSAS
jgi:hypothetical protein